VSEPLIPVYRMHQPTLISPCSLGEPCHSCAIHAYCLSDPCKGCRRGKRYECERAYPAPPAFAVRIPAALQLVRDGAAAFIHQNNALQLTFARLTYLRDVSCKIDGRAIWDYVAGSQRIRIAVYLGWRIPVATITFVQGDLEPEDETELDIEAIEETLLSAVSLEA
jgi:hypothetical protein